ncbi:MAG TPA: hypothetical protein ENI77_00045 [Nitrospirae bacterium]|nr:hypothetical protein [Nitrospirota bacterium]
MTTKKNNPVLKWEKAGWVFLLIFATSDLFSISIAQTAVVGMGITWIGRWVKSGESPDLSPVKWPLAAFVVSSLIAAIFSLNPVESFRDSKDLLQIIIFFSAYDLFSRDIKRIGTVFRVMTATGAGIAVFGLFQAFNRGLDINDRISGFNDIYMTYAGLLMLAIIVGAAVLLFEFKKWADSWIPVALGLMVAAVLLSLTRNALVGIVAGSVVMVALRKPVALAAIPALMAIAIAVTPRIASDRVYSIFDLQNETNKERIYLWSAGLKIIRDNPLFGVGQNSFPIVYPKYRNPNVKEPNISHLHNNFMEIAAERGLVGLFCWMSVWVFALWIMIRSWRQNRRDKKADILGTPAGIGGITAFVCAGVFEYNFGDSEIQMFYYFILAGGMASVKSCLSCAEESFSSTGGGKARMEG